MRHLTADLLLLIRNPFEARPTNGWCFSLRATAFEYEDHNGSDPPNYPARETAASRPDLVDLFEKRMAQKFDARWHQTTTLYHRHDVETA